MVSLAGDWFSFVAVAGLVTELTGSLGAPAFVYAAAVIPAVIAAPFAGTLADRFDRKRILVIADVVRVPLALLLCLAAWWRSMPLAVISVVSLAVGASFSEPIASAATPNLVSVEELATAQSLMSAVWGTMLMVGAGLGGVIADLCGRQTAFVLNALSFAISAVWILGIRRPMQRVRDPASSSGRVVHTGTLREAFTYVRSHPIVFRLSLTKAAASIATGIVGLLPAFALHHYAGTDIATGLLFAARGIGAMLGPIFARRVLGGDPTPRAIIVVCGVSSMLFCTAYTGFSFTHTFALALLLVITAHLGGGSLWAFSTLGLHMQTADHVRGRVMALDYGFATLALGISASVAGVLADSVGEVSALRCLAAAGALAGVTWFVWSLGAVRRSR